MGAIMNGMALHGGVIPYGGTFFVFSDYLRPSMRLAALMGLRVACLCAGISLGRRSGFCPLFPPMCALCWLPTAALWRNVYSLFQLLPALLPALRGNLLGAWRRKREG